MKRSIRMAAAALIFFCALGVAFAQQGSGPIQYRSTTYSGVLLYPKSGDPLAGARVRMKTGDGQRFEAQTDNAGNFEIAGMPFGNYTLEIRTAAGELIQAVNTVRLEGTDTVKIRFRISDRITSSTIIENQPDRYVVATTVPEWNKKRFWREFGIFMLLAGSAGAAAW